MKKKPLVTKKDSGAAALEYLIISIFALVLAFASINFVVKIFKSKLHKYTEQLGLEGEMNGEEFLNGLTSEE